MSMRVLVILILVLVGGAAGMFVGSKMTDKPLPSVATTPAPNVKPFALVNQDGQVVSDVTYRGRWLLVFFGFTRCPDVCPTSMIYASNLMKDLGQLADTLDILFVSIDPERDTAQALKEYLGHFDGRIIGLTGSPEQIAAITKGYGVYYTKRKLEGVDDYTMDHSTAFYLVGPDGGLRRAYSLQRGEDEMTAEIRSAITPKE
jgi:protein SCO1/2